MQTATKVNGLRNAQAQTQLNNMRSELLLMGIDMQVTVVRENTPDEYWQGVITDIQTAINTPQVILNALPYGSNEYGIALNSTLQGSAILEIRPLYTF